MEVEVLRELITYYPDSGLVYWNERDSKFFSSERICKSWNTKYAYKICGNKHNMGYLDCEILGNRYLLHRIIWLYMTGEFPKGVIDHINGNKSDNRWDNLRDVPQSVNSKNSRMKTNNSSGFNGVVWCKKDKVWFSRIRVNYRNIHIGSFKSKEEAILARIKANKEYGFHENHGKVV